jgi:hypothetical protein
MSDFPPNIQAEWNLAMDEFAAMSRPRRRAWRREIERECARELRDEKRK